MWLQVYDHQYKAVVDGVETDSVMEIDPVRRVEIFRMGNGSNEVLEVHDFKNVSATPGSHCHSPVGEGESSSKEGAGGGEE